jgi:mRNA interferase MazF
MRSADILLVDFPFSDAAGTKLRPAIIVSSDHFHAGDDVVVLPISSRASLGDAFSYDLDPAAPEFRLTGLKPPSSVKWTKPVTISRQLVRRRLGRLSKKPFDEVRELLRSVFSYRP